MNAALASAVYEGQVTHRRHRPHAHQFTYRMAQLYLDLDELETAFRGRWLWSVNRRNLAQWRRSDYLGPSSQPLADAVRERIRATTGDRHSGPIRMLTHLRYAGHVFNPVTFYYCFGADGAALEYIVAEITNTPWAQRHAYVLDSRATARAGQVLGWEFDKTFHVSPFIGMERRYAWQFTAPSQVLSVHMQVSEGTGREFDATLSLRRRPLDGAGLARVLCRYPLMTAQVVAAIHWQALRLWIMGTPVHAHPGGTGIVAPGRAPGDAA